MKDKLFLGGSILLVMALHSSNAAASYDAKTANVVDRFLHSSGIFAVVDGLSGAIGKLGTLTGGERPLTEGPTSRRTTTDAAPVNAMATSFN